MSSNNPIPVEGIEQNGFVYRFVTEVRNNKYVKICPCGEILESLSSGFKCKNGHWSCA